MNESPENELEKAMENLAETSGLAVSIIDSSKREVSLSNNNSICQYLNPGPGFSPACAKYCGAAFEKATRSGKVLKYECHAGLECRAVPFKAGKSPFVAVLGRSFTNSEKYREATKRAISGDWREFPPNEFFENVLLSGSSAVLDQTVKEFKALAVKRPAERPPAQTPDSSTNPAVDESEKTPVGAEPAPADESASEKPDAAAWRSFFGSILENEYDEAAAAILKFISGQFGYKTMIWLKKRGSRLQHSAAIGEMADRKVKLGIDTNDERLREALAGQRSLELDERRKGNTGGRTRTMTLFPLGVSGHVTGAIAVLDPITDEAHAAQILRICRSVASQLEILRLRDEVDRGDTLATAIRRFSESLKRLDNEDLWLSVTQNAAEMLRAERSSLLVFDEKSNEFKIKAMLGAQLSERADEEIGDRVAKFVFSRNRAIAVADIAKTGLQPETPDRSYKTSSFLSCPISVGGKTIGVMNFADRAGGEAFDKSSLELFEAIAPQLAVAIDRASLKEIAGEYEQLSVTDALTGLLNRRYIQERLMEEVKRSNRHGYPMSFMMLDVDNFKPYNDTFGHPAGDEALKIVASVIRETLRGADVAARFGGEEFAILLPQTTSDEARAIADRIRSNIAETTFPHRAVTVSIGVASCSAELCITADLVSAADQALYAAKRGGRNKVLTFDEMKFRRPAKP